MMRKNMMTILCGFLLCGLAIPTFAESKNMTVEGVAKANAGDIIEVPYIGIAKYCDFTQQIVPVPDNVNGAMYECIYIGSERPGNLEHKIIRVAQAQKAFASKQKQSKSWVSKWFSKKN